MDASVLAAIARWPNVPDVYGWLRLTARGEWRLRGEPIANAAIREFIGRNYACDARGRWFFQNGPQRVYVELELAPWVYRFDGAGALRTHTGAQAQQLLDAALVDGETFVLRTELGAGNTDDRDIERLVAVLTDAQGQALDDAGLARALRGEAPMYVEVGRCGLHGGRVPVQQLPSAGLGEAFGFVAAPKEC